MMGRTTLRLVLLVSCAHALVHIYEVSLPSVEQEIAGEFKPHDSEAGKQLTGKLSNCWRFAWGAGALLAGWLVDGYGARRMLAIYLLGCGAMCLVASFCFSLSLLFTAMLLMGAFASIYHPAGLALISHETTAANRPRALGLHGIFGSLGIGAAPLLAAAVLTTGFGWRQYYWLLAAPGLMFGIFFLWKARQDKAETETSSSQTNSSSAKSISTDTTDWRSYFTLCLIAMLQGFIYSAVLSFLPRYLSTGSDASFTDSLAGKYWTSAVLLMGCIGQYTAGRFARHARLESQLTWITIGNIPFLILMGFAVGWQRPIVAGLFALVHFMHQPLYNSLVAKYTPANRRSLCYGFSFAMGFGLGSFGSLFAGYSPNDTVTYGFLAFAALVAAGLGAILWRQNPQHAQPIDAH